MLSFSSICQELEADLEQQKTKLDIFSKNNFIWLDKIRQKVDPQSQKPEPKEEPKIKGVLKRKSSFNNNVVKEQENNDNEKLYSSSKLQTEEFVKIETGDTVDIEESHPSKLSLISLNKNENELIQKTPPPRSSLRTNVPPRPHDFNSDSPIGSPLIQESNRHVSFGVARDNMDQIQQPADSPIILKSDMHVDVLSSDSDAQASPLTLARTNENTTSNVTPQRSSLVRQVIHSSYDQMILNDKSHEIMGNHSDIESVSSDLSAGSYFPSDSGPMPSPLKEEQKTEQNQKRVYADSKDIRLSLDPTQILLSTEEFTTTNAGTFSVASSAIELTVQAKLMREKWAKMVAEKNQVQAAPVEQEKDDDAESKDDHTVYQISDHESDADDDDDKELEMFDSDPDEVHGKKVPNWAHGEGLKKCLIKQSKIDPDTIFPNFSNTCQLEVVFGKVNTKWQMRADSAKWDQDGLTAEEIKSFKKIAGYA
ncbi:hypothetical protein TVAG_058760 [Trichomonas vaginalis G3]|uniref:Inner centromere protein ARK-binding domain-containing protein n=1 Tax=Trichomonas vaginalis (strain ATCC PRA-98 / G3) TaxID=412133 RepID=A2FJZ0_TRIV3|nr:inner centromere protein, ARK binding region-containing protein [Trichomonas vaginalis G3]EAX94786.1 hypothetical protein TVAG_058760 [Trichomonas vaginalis G3]KAI5518426.1 inner centromere protein, ARK binding region-containing protein [Trichomonas vaginalis G3]|eukprot:XP_001307716.1 hypothetical protein [Trichomonas vaginalis G3]